MGLWKGPDGGSLLGTLAFRMGAGPRATGCDSLPGSVLLPEDRDSLDSGHFGVEKGHLESKKSSREGHQGDIKCPSVTSSQGV